MRQKGTHPSSWYASDTPPPKMAVCDRAVQLIRARPRHAPRLRPSTARLGVLHPAPASPRAVRARRRRTTSGRAEHLWTKCRASTFGKENHLNHLVGQPSREAIGVLVLMLMLASATLALCSMSIVDVVHVDDFNGDSRVDSPGGLLCNKQSSGNGTCFKSSSKRGLPLLDKPL